MFIAVLFSLKKGLEIVSQVKGQTNYGETHNKILLSRKKDQYYIIPVYAITEKANCEDGKSINGWGREGVIDRQLSRNFYSVETTLYGTELMYV